MNRDTDESQVLQRRAAALAQRPPAEGDGASADFLAVRAGAQRCAIELRWLRHVKPLGPLGALPLVAPAVLGLAHWDEQILHVLRLADLLGTGGDTPASHLLIAGTGGRMLGIAVEGVEQVMRLGMEQVRTRSAPIETVRPELVQGLAGDGTLVLDMERLAATDALLRRRPAGARH